MTLNIEAIKKISEALQGKRIETIAVPCEGQIDLYLQRGDVVTISVAFTSAEDASLHFNITRNINLGTI
jgi:hypothetical protein